MRVGGGTAISTWIDLVRTLVEPLAGAIRIAYLMTDGRNEHDPPAALDEAVARAIGVFQCDARGVGADWSVRELDKIASVLLGDVDIIKRPDEMERDFLEFMDRAIGKTVPDVRLRMWTPRGSTVRFLRQVAPTIEDLGEGARIDPLTVDYPTGAWAGEESRDYHLCVDVPPGEVGDEKLAARVSVVVGEDAVASGLVRAVWTDDLERSTRLNARVARYARQEEAAEVIREGLEARREGDFGLATAKLARAVELVEAAGNEGTLKLLRQVVEVDDDGTVKVKRHIEEDDAKEVLLGSRRTVRVRKPSPGGIVEEAKR